MANSDREPRSSRLRAGPWILLLVLAAAPLLTCGGKSDDPSAPPPSNAPAAIGEQEFWELFVDRNCALLSACCEGSPVPFDPASCRASFEQALYQLFEQYGPGAVYDGAAAAACLEGYSEAFGRCVLQSVETMRLCIAAYNGVSPGGACSHDGACFGAARCEPDASGSLVCVDYGATPGREGEACFTTCPGVPGDDERCSRVATFEPQARPCYGGDDLRCDPVTQRCLRLPAVGEPCDSVCVAEAYCDSTTRRCTRTPSAGEPCNGPCAAEAYCDHDLMRCEPRLGDGEPCSSSLQCRAGTCPNGRCGAEIAVDCGAN